MEKRIEYLANLQRPFIKLNNYCNYMIDTTNHIYKKNSNQRRTLFALEKQICQCLKSNLDDIACSTIGLEEDKLFYEITKNIPTGIFYNLKVGKILYIDLFELFIYIEEEIKIIKSILKNQIDKPFYSDKIDSYYKNTNKTIEKIEKIINTILLINFELNKKMKLSETHTITYNIKMSLCPFIETFRINNEVQFDCVAFFEEDGEVRIVYSNVEGICPFKHREFKTRKQYDAFFKKRDIEWLSKGRDYNRYSQLLFNIKDYRPTTDMAHSLKKKILNGYQKDGIIINASNYRSTDRID